MSKELRLAELFKEYLRTYDSTIELSRQMAAPHDEDSAEQFEEEQQRLVQLITYETTLSTDLKSLLRQGALVPSYLPTKELREFACKGMVTVLESKGTPREVLYCKARELQMVTWRMFHAGMGFSWGREEKASEVASQFPNNDVWAEEVHFCYLAKAWNLLSQGVDVKNFIKTLYLLQHDEVQEEKKSD